MQFSYDQVVWQYWGGEPFNSLIIDSPFHYYVHSMRAKDFPCLLIIESLVPTIGSGMWGAHYSIHYSFIHLNYYTWESMRNF